MMPPEGSRWQTVGGSVWCVVRLVVERSGAWCARVHREGLPTGGVDAAWRWSSDWPASWVRIEDADEWPDDDEEAA